MQLYKKTNILYRFKIRCSVIGSVDVQGGMVQNMVCGESRDTMQTLNNFLAVFWTLHV